MILHPSSTLVSPWSPHGSRNISIFNPIVIIYLQHLLQSATSNKMKAPFFIITLLLSMVFYRLYTPVPQDIDEKIKFRIFIGVTKVFKFVGSVMTLFNNKPAMQNLNDLALALQPQPPSTIEGSNIRSKVVTFDGVRVLLYEPINRKGRESVAGLMFYHGGGYMLGSPEMYDPLTRQLAEELDIVIASVDYCLATEHEFPAAHEDSMKALRYFLNHASEFGVDPTHIGVAGDSAGGHLAAAVAQEASDDPTLPRLKIQVLLYPLLQLLDLKTPSYQKHVHDFGLTGDILDDHTLGIFRSVYLLGRIDEDFMTAFRVNNHTSLDFKKDNPTYYNHQLVPTALRKHVSYKGPVMEAGNDELWAKYKHLFQDTRVSPLIRKDLSRLPPAYIVSCQYDSLRDDAIMYAARLEAAGVEAKLINYYNGWHGMFNAPRFEVGRRSIQYLVQHLKRNL